MSIESYVNVYNGNTYKTDKLREDFKHVIIGEYTIEDKHYLTRNLGEFIIAHMNDSLMANYS